MSDQLIRQRQLLRAPNRFHPARSPFAGLFLSRENGHRGRAVSSDANRGTFFLKSSNESHANREPLLLEGLGEKAEYVAASVPMHAGVMSCRYIDGLLPCRAASQRARG